jgi:hypothetical protein
MVDKAFQKKNIEGWFQWKRHVSPARMVRQLQAADERREWIDATGT